MKASVYLYLSLNCTLIVVKASSKAQALVLCTIFTSVKEDDLSTKVTSDS